MIASPKKAAAPKPRRHRRTTASSSTPTVREQLKNRRAQYTATKQEDPPPTPASDLNKYSTLPPVGQTPVEPNSPEPNSPEPVHQAQQHDHDHNCNHDHDHDHDHDHQQEVQEVQEVEQPRTKTPSSRANDRYSASSSRSRDRATPSELAVPKSGTKQSKKQQEAAARKAREEDRKKAIAARKQKRDAIHAKFSEQRKRESQAAAAEEDGTEPAGEMNRPISASRDTVVSIGDRVVFNESNIDEDLGDMGGGETMEDLMNNQPASPEPEQEPVASPAKVAKAAPKKQPSPTPPPAPVAVAKKPSPAVMKSLTTKTGSVKRLTKDVQSYVQQVEAQLEEVATLKASGGDPHAVKKLGDTLHETRNTITGVRNRLTTAEKQLSKVMSANTTTLQGTDELMFAQLAIDGVEDAKEAAQGAEGSAMQASMEAEQWSERQLKKGAQAPPPQPAAPVEVAATKPPAPAEAATPKPPKTPSKKAGTKAGSRTPRASRAKKVAKTPEPTKDEAPRALSPSTNTDVYAQAAMQADAQPVQMNLVACKCCSRKFNAERIAKHETACEKSKAANDKRKKFDQAKARLAGTDAAQFAGKSSKNEKRYEKAAARSKNWKVKSEAFRAAMRGAKDPNAAPAPPVENPDFVKCPHCARTFNEGAAERHVPRCKESSMKAKNKPTKKGKAKYDPRKR